MLRAVDTVTFDENVTPSTHTNERDMKDSPLLDIAKEYEILEQHVEDIRRVSAYLTTGVWYQGRHMSESLSGIWPFYQPRTIRFCGKPNKLSIETIKHASAVTDCSCLMLSPRNHIASKGVLGP
jgi:hypothetical protein